MDNELEDVIKCRPFLTKPLFTGKKNAGPLEEKYRQMGTFKGLVRLITPGDEGASPVDQKELLLPKQLFCRLYVLVGSKLIPKDSDGMSDPYLIIKVQELLDSHPSKRGFY